MKRFSIWIHQVMPPKWVIVLWVGFYCLLISLPPLFSWTYGLTEIDWSDLQYQNAAQLILGLFAFLSAVFRVLAFHPFFNPDYLFWLNQTPWTYTKPLPNGPLTLVPQDAIIVGLMSFSHYLVSPDHWFLTPVVFLFAHSLLIWLSLILTRHFYQTYLMVFLLSAFLYVYQNPVLVSLLIVVLSAIAHWGIREVLQSFHEWSSERRQNTPFLQLSSEKAKEIQREKLLGWPYDRLGPHTASSNLSTGWSTAIALLLGWWCFSVLQNLPLKVEKVHGLLLFFLWAGSWISVAVCMSGYAPPISVLGRIRTGRWIIPGYDHIFLSPIIIGGVLLLSVAIQVLHLTPFSVNAGLTTAASVFLSFYLAPDLTEWRLTGNHRIVAGVGYGQQQELQQTQ